MRNELNHQEEQDIREIIEVMKKFLQQEYPSGTIRRNFHPKLHACLKAILAVRKDIPGELRFGLFREAESYQAWIRFSNAPPKIKSDRNSSGRGLALKILNVHGEVLEEDPIGVKCQNILLTTSPILSTWNIALYKKAIKAVLFGFWPRLQFSLNPKHWRSIFLTLRHSKKHDNLLAQHYFSGAAFRCGPKQFVKFMLVPQNPTLGYSLNKPKSDNFLKEQLKEDLRQASHAFTLHVQVHTNEEQEPLENTSIEWKTGSVPVADLYIPAQDFDYPERVEFGEGLEFSPWFCLKDHEPVGAINRARKEVYRELSGLRRSSQEGTSSLQQTS